VDVLIAELVDTTHAAATLENLSPIALLLTQWQHSAEIYAAPRCSPSSPANPRATTRPTSPSCPPNQHTPAG